MNVKLGINTCFAVKRWPLGKDWVRIVKEDLELNCAQFSFDLLDPILHKDSRDVMVEEIKKAARNYQVDISTTFTGLVGYCFNLLLHPSPAMRRDALCWYEEAIKMTAKLGAKGTGGHVGALSMDDLRHSERKKYLMQHLIDSLQHLSQIGSKEGLSYLLWEPMPVPRERPITISEAKDLYDKVNEKSALPIYYCLDVGHQCTYSVRGKDRSPYAWIKELAPQSPVIHIQQTDGKGDRHWPFTFKYNKKGIIVPSKILEAIECSGADQVTLILEVVHPFEAEETKIKTDLKESVEYWKKFL